MKEYLKDVHGFQEENITVLMDDGEHTQPNKANILAAYRKLVDDAEAGDAVFCHYSGTFHFMPIFEYTIEDCFMRLTLANCTT
jgi:hypothetical protein